MNIKDIRGMMAIVAMLVLLGVATCQKARADYMLVMVDLHKESHPTITFEPFETYPQCRKRGLKNQALLQYYMLHVGFKCEPFKKGSFGVVMGE